MGFGQVKLVNFGVGAERTAYKRELGLEEIVLCKTFVQFAENFFARLLFEESSADERLREAALTVVGHGGYAA